MAATHALARILAGPAGPGMYATFLLKSEFLTDRAKQGILLYTWGWLSPGGLHGLQNRPKGAAEAALVGSTPIHSRLLVPLSRERIVSQEKYQDAAGQIARGLD
jgi:hypothetical protein